MKAIVALWRWLGITSLALLMTSVALVVNVREQKAFQDSQPVWKEATEVYTNPPSYFSSLAMLDSSDNKWITVNHKTGRTNRVLFLEYKKQRLPLNFVLVEGQEFTIECKTNAVYVVNTWITNVIKVENVITNAMGVGAYTNVWRHKQK